MNMKTTVYKSTRLPFYILPTISVWVCGGKLKKSVAFVEVMWARSTIRFAIYWNQTATA